MRRIEGQLLPGQRVLLVEDLATDGRTSQFRQGDPRRRGRCDHCFVIFFYDIYPEGKKIMADSRRHATRIDYLVGCAGRRQGRRQVRR